MSYSFPRVNSLVPDVRTKSVSVSTASTVFQCLSLQGRPVVWHTQSASPIFHCHIAVQHIFLEGTDLKVSSKCISPDKTLCGSDGVDADSKARANLLFTICLRVVNVLVIMKYI